WGELVSVSALGGGFFRGGSAAHVGVEVSEELRRKLLGRRFNQAATELGNLATNIRLGSVGEDRRVRTILLEGHIRAALGKASDATLALAGDRVGIRRVKVLE